MLSLLHRIKKLESPHQIPQRPGSHGDNILLMVRLIMHVVLISPKGTDIHYDNADYDKETTLSSTPNPTWSTGA